MRGSRRREHSRIIPLEFTGAANLRQLGAITGQSVAFKVLNYDREAEVLTGSRTAALDHMEPSH